jgi:ADP-ribosylglycohydrolase
MVREIYATLRSALLRVLLLVLLTAVGLATAVPAYGGDVRRISVDDLRDRVRGAWAGKMIGVAEGAPTEFRFCGQLVPDEKMPAWKPQMIREALRQDDLYVQMAFAAVLDAKGLDASTADFGEMFRETKFNVWHASQAARRNLRRGVSPMETGTPRYTAHGNDIAFQINSDFAGLMCPGMPQASNDLIARAARLTCWGDGQYGGMFVAGMYAAAFFEHGDNRKVVEAGLKCVPPDSEYAKAIADVLAWSTEQPDDWKAVWAKVNAKRDGQDRCPYGALEPLNIDAKVNGSYLAIGLLYGGDHFFKTIEIATRCGQDSDCNPSTAGGIWAAMRGFKAIPPQYTAGLAEIAATEKFVYTDYTFDSIVESTMKRAAAMIERAGGKRDGDGFLIAVQQPRPTPAPQFQIGKPVERIACDDPRWTWTGPWKRDAAKRSGPEKVASEKGAEAQIEFEGTGACICGPYIGAGGTADVYVDGKLDRTVDVWPDDGIRKAMEDVWHRFDLPAGKHTIRLVVRGERFRESSGSEIRIHDLIVYR